MRLMSLFILAILLINTSAKAQTTNNDVFNSDKEIIFLGVDYSHAQFIGAVSGWGEVSTKAPKEIRDMYFSLWNSTIEAEPQHFKFAEAMDRKNIPLNTNAVSKTNSSAKTEHLFLDSESDAKELTEKEIAGMVKKYDYKKSSSIGLSFICEQMNKNAKSATYWVTFIDLQSGNVLLSKKMIGDAGGFGFKNYWLGSVKSVIKQMKKELKTWK